MNGKRCEDFVCAFIGHERGVWAGRCAGLPLGRDAQCRNEPADISTGRCYKRTVGSRASVVTSVGASFAIAIRRR